MKEADGPDRDMGDYQDTHEFAIIIKKMPHLLKIIINAYLDGYQCGHEHGLQMQSIDANEGKNNVP